MARKKLVYRALPLPSSAMLKAGTNPGLRLLEILRGVALKNQRPETETFYPIRHVARHFHVPTSTVARIYDQLEQEGILVSVRGSKTLLQGLNSGRHLRVLGFVGLPAFTPSFVTLQGYRAFFLRIRRELRARGFAVATVFYDRSDTKQDRLAGRIGKYDFDTVIWHEPDRAAKEIAPSLKDGGIRVIGVSDRGFPSIRCEYEVQRERAILTILKDWRTRGHIESVVVVRGVERSAAKEELLRHLLEEQALPFEFKDAGHLHLGQFSQSIGTNGNTGVIFPSMTAAMFAFRAPDALAKLMMRMRVAFTGGPVSIPFAKVPDVAGDLVVVDWQLVAEQIVSDLINLKASDRSDAKVFEAKAHVRAPLSQYAQSL